MTSMQPIGEDEMRTLRTRNIGYAPTQNEILWNILPYLAQQYVFQLLYGVQSALRYLTHRVAKFREIARLLFGRSLRVIWRRLIVPLILSLR
jgi:hypothetical protein